MGSPYEPQPLKRNPQDTTLRNLRAIKARVTKLEKRVDKLEKGNQ